MIGTDTITEDKFDPVDKNLQQEIKEMQNALLSLREMLNLMEHISYDDIKHIQELPE